MRHAHVVLGCTLLTAVACTSPDAVAPRSGVETVEAAPLAAAFPDVIALPTGFSPEGIAAGRGTTFYVGSIPGGAIWRGDARTGTGEILVAPQAGRFAVGMQYDARGDRLFVAGAFTGQAYVYDATTGALLATYQLTAPGTLVNDVVITRDAAYFTDSSRPVLYRLAFGPGGSLLGAGAVTEILLTGDYQFIGGAINGNGIVATPGDRWLVTVNSASGELYRVDPATGVATAIDLGGGSLIAGDGMLLIGRTLYVVQGPLNQVSVVELSADFTSGTIERTITDSDFGFPTTVASIGSSLYVVNGHFDVAPPPAPAPGVAFEVVRVGR